MSENNGYVTREALLGKPLVRSYADVEIDGKRFRLRSLTAGESNSAVSKHLALEDEDKRAQALASLPARIVVQCCVDDEGHRIFSDTDVAALLDLDARFMKRLVEACQKHSGMEGATEEAAEKNSAQIPS